ncbi:hypothetical protein [Microbacterium xylanilyticum]
MRTILVVFYATAAIVLSCLARVIVMGWYYPGLGVLRFAYVIRRTARALLAEGDRLRQ